MYKSPIELCISDIYTRIREEQDKKIYQAVQEIGLNVDKNALIKALEYDRAQYTAGFKDGIIHLSLILKRLYTKDKFVRLSESRLQTIIDDALLELY